MLFRSFFFFPMHLYNVVRSGVDPLIAKITRVVPVASQDREMLSVKREAQTGGVMNRPQDVSDNASRDTLHASRGKE